MPTEEISEKSDAPIPYGRQSINQADIDAVIDVLRSEFLTQGPAVTRFEKAVAAKVGARHAIASCNATASLHLACLALGVGSEDIVWTSPVTFVASANCARYCGAKVDFVDIDPQTYNMSVDRLHQKLLDARKRGQLPKVVIPVHLAGHPANMLEIQALSSEFGFHVVEDASHAIGGHYNNIMIGSCAHSDITVFSFHPVKLITTGEGGMALTNDCDLARRMARLNSHGITRDPSEMTQLADGPWYYQQVELGHNYRMTDIQAALGMSQLNRLERFVARRHELAARYDEAFSELPIISPWRDPHNYSGFHLYIIRLNSPDTERHRTIFERLRSRGILVNLHYIPIYRQPDFSQYGFDWSDFPESEDYYHSAITIPLFPAMTDNEQERVISEVRRAVTE